MSNIDKLTSKELCELAYKIEKGKEGYKEDPVEAARLYKVAADRGFPYGIYFHGINLLLGRGLPVDKEKGIEYIKMAANKGCGYAIDYLGNMYKEGKIVPKDINKAAEYFKMGADNINDDKLMRQISRGSYCDLFLNGLIPFDPKIHFKYLDDCIEDGAVSFALEIGNRYYYGKNSFKVNKVEAAKYYKKGADVNEKECCYLLAKMLINGDGIPADKKEAVKILERMTKVANHKYGNVLYGKMCYNGDTVPVDKAKAADLFDGSTQENSLEGLYLYGKMMYEGDGIPQDVKFGMLFLEKAANKNYKDAKDYLLKIKNKNQSSGNDTNKKKATVSNSDDDNSKDDDDDDDYVAKPSIRRDYYRPAQSSKPKETYIMPYDGGFTKYRKGTYKVDGEYIMPYDGGFTKSKRGTYKFDGTFLMPYDGGFTKYRKGSYKVEGEYIMPYDGGFTKSKRGTYKIDGDFDYAYLIIPIIH